LAGASTGLGTMRARSLLAGARTGARTPAASSSPANWGFAESLPRRIPGAGGDPDALSFIGQAGDANPSPVGVSVGATAGMLRGP